MKYEPELTSSSCKAVFYENNDEDKPFEVEVFFEYYYYGSLYRILIADYGVSQEDWNRIVSANQKEYAKETFIDAIEAALGRYCEFR
jgi:hypothetical protein